MSYMNQLGKTLEFLIVKVYSELKQFHFLLKNILLCVWHKKNTFKTIIDSHALVRNNTEIPCALSSVAPKGNIFKTIMNPINSIRPLKKNAFVYYLLGCIGLSGREQDFSLPHRDFLIVVPGFSCSTAYGILLSPLGIEPMFPALQGGFLTTGPPGKLQDTALWLLFDSVTSSTLLHYVTLTFFSQ